MNEPFSETKGSLFSSERAGSKPACRTGNLRDVTMKGKDIHTLLSAEFKMVVLKILCAQSQLFKVEDSLEIST